MCYVALAGNAIEISHLKNSLAASMVGSIEAEGSFSYLIECRRDDGDEIVVFDIEVERPQSPINDIKRTERIAVRFCADGSMPETLALRDDFPLVPHLNLTDHEYPRSLCLYDQPWKDLQLNWSSGMHLSMIQWWLSQTSRGELHGDDQPLEPLLLTNMDLVVSADLGKPNGAAHEFVYLAADDSDGRTVIVSESITGAKQFGKPFLVLALNTPPQVHGVICRTPQTLKELAALIDIDGSYSLLDALRSALWKLPEIHRNSEVIGKFRFALVLCLPKTRTSGGEIETYEYKAFVSLDNIATVGVKCGAWELHNGIPGPLLSKDNLHDGGDLQGEPANVIRHLTRQQAALYSGREKSDDRQVLAIGVGALGSQVVMNLARAGFGKWALVDNDRFMPHNAVRHLLYGGYVTGLPKADCLEACINGLTSNGDTATSIACDFLAPGDKADDVRKHIQNTDLILDLSASIAVERNISYSEHSARAISTFLSPNGHDLVVLCEGRDRSVRLAELEMAYYFALAAHPGLTGHLNPPAGVERYGGGCRDVSIGMPQYLVSMHAGIATNALLKLADSDEPAIHLWRSNHEHLGSLLFELPIISFTTEQIEGWQVSIGDNVLKEIRQFRNDRLPNETGGILIGNIDQERKHIHIVRVLPSPPDSEEWPTVYIRGKSGLREERDRIVQATDGNLDYLGEWHSHPIKHSVAASSDDEVVFSWISKHAKADGRPGIMLISGDDRLRVFTESLDNFVEIVYV